jgi:hypothetical protein
VLDESEKVFENAEQEVEDMGDSSHLEVTPEDLLSEDLLSHLEREDDEAPNLVHVLESFELDMEVPEGDSW